MVITTTGLEGTIQPLFQAGHALAPALVDLFFKRHGCEQRYSRDEALCDAYIGLWKAAKSYVPAKGKAFRSWAWSKIIYELQTGLRDAQRRGTQAQSWTDLIATRASEECRHDEDLVPEVATTDGIEAYIQREFVARLMDHLSPEQRELVYRHYALDESVPRLAQQRGTSRRAVFYRLSTIRRKLQAHYV